MMRKKRRRRKTEEEEEEEPHQLSPESVKPLKAPHWLICSRGRKIIMSQTCYYSDSSALKLINNFFFFPINGISQPLS